MSRLTSEDAQVEELWETGLVWINGEEYEWEWNAFCDKCWCKIRAVLNPSQCPDCERFIT